MTAINKCDYVDSSGQTPCPLSLELYNSNKPTSTWTAKIKCQQWYIIPIMTLHDYKLWVADINLTVKH